MMPKSLALTFILSCFTFFASSAFAAPFKVLVVMSYEQDFHWSKAIKKGIESALLTEADLTFFYMDTKVNKAGGDQKASEAFALYKSLNPDGVITIDDNAQSMFVVPYLKDKVSTPVMFAGVNAAPAKYGFPNNHISGVLERGHIRESIVFLQQLMPEVRRIGFITKDSPSGKAVIGQVEEEKSDYAARICGIEFVHDVATVKAAAKSLSESCDAVYIDGAAGIKKPQGGSLSYSELFSLVAQDFSGPIIGANGHHVESGAFSAVVKTGYEQGNRAGSLLLKAMQGTPVSEIPVTRNYRGKRVLNATAVKKFSITPRPVLLRGVQLVRGQ